MLKKLLILDRREREREKERRRHEGEGDSSNGERGVVACRHVERAHSLRNCSPATGRHVQVYTYPTMPSLVAGESEEITNFSLSRFSAPVQSWKFSRWIWPLLD